LKDRFGFIHDKSEIKLLILFVLRHFPDPVSFEALWDIITTCDDGVDYFEFTVCLKALVDNGHILLKNEMYSPTQKGVRNSYVTEANLPYSVREKAEQETATARMAQNRNTMIKTSNTAVPDGGFKVCLSLSDGIGDVVSMELFAANEKQALALEKGFRKNAEGIYNKLIEMILE